MITVKNSKKKYLFWSAIFLITFFWVYAFCEFARGNLYIKNFKADYYLDALEIMNSYEQDTSVTNIKFKDMVMDVTGKVSKTDNNAYPFILFMQHPEKKSSVKFRMDSVYGK